MKKKIGYAVLLVSLMLTTVLVWQFTLNSKASTLTATGIVGDANGDAQEGQTANVGDLVRMMRYMNGTTDDISIDADLNKDGSIKTTGDKDCEYLAKLLVGLYQTEATDKTVEVGKYDNGTTDLGNFDVTFTSAQTALIENAKMQSVAVGGSEFTTKTE